MVSTKQAEVHEQANFSHQFSKQVDIFLSNFFPSGSMLGLFCFLHFLRLYRLVFGPHLAKAVLYKIMETFKVCILVSLCLTAFPYIKPEPVARS